MRRVATQLTVLAVLGLCGAVYLEITGREPSVLDLPVSSPSLPAPPSLTPFPAAPLDLMSRCVAVEQTASRQPLPGLLAVYESDWEHPQTLPLRQGEAELLRRGSWGALYSIPDTLDPREVMADLPHTEPVWERRPAGWEPNDPGVQHQWHLQMLGINRLYPRSTGEGVRVAVIDTGVTAGDDGPAKVLPGEDLVQPGGTGEDHNGHGSAVAAVLGQTTNNARGFAGIAPEVEILPLRVCDSRGSCSSDLIAEAIDRAVEMKARVINVSVAGPNATEVEYRAVKRARSAGVWVVAAAGNGMGGLEFPAGLPDVVSVGALDADGRPTGYSARGVQLDFWAPGGDCDHPLLQQVAGGETRVWGTSYAAPLVSGAIALGMAAGLSGNEIVARLKNTAAPVSGSLTGALNPSGLWLKPVLRKTCHVDLATRDVRCGEGLRVEVDWDDGPLGSERRRGGLRLKVRVLTSLRSAKSLSTTLERVRGGAFAVSLGEVLEVPDEQWVHVADCCHPEWGCDRGQLICGEDANMPIARIRSGLCVAYFWGGPSLECEATAASTTTWTARQYLSTTAGEQYPSVIGGGGSLGPDYGDWTVDLSQIVPPNPAVVHVVALPQTPGVVADALEIRLR